MADRPTRPEPSGRRPTPRTRDPRARSHRDRERQAPDGGSARSTGSTPAAPQRATPPRPPAPTKSAPTRSAPTKSAQPKAAPGRPPAGRAAPPPAPTVPPSPSTPASTPTAAPPLRGRPRAIDALLVRPRTDGPRVRLGILWFLVAMAAATAGRWSTALLFGLVAAVAAVQTVAVWQDVDGPGGPSRLPPPVRLLAGLLTLSVVLATAAGTGTGGAVLLVATVVAAVAGRSLGGAPAAAVLLTAVVVPAVAAGAVVLAVRVDTVAGLFLVLALSLYDAGAYVLGSESTSRVEGPLGGVIGVLAVTFTMAAFPAPPFDTATAWLTGVVVALACPLGQWVVSACLPSASSPAGALRRLDAYVLAAPLFVAGAWAAGG